MKLSTSDEKMKELIKEAIIEIAKERKEILYEIILEAVEEIGLANAIKKGRKNKFVNEREILTILES